MKDSFMGYRRENGRVGVRNHVVLMPLDDLSNTVCRNVSHMVNGTVYVDHPYGRLQFGSDLDLHFKTLIGAASNPNVAAAIIVGIEETWTDRVVQAVASTGKPVFGFGIEQVGDLQTSCNVARKARELVRWASGLHRTECALNELWVSTKCGESDTTSGLASCPTVGNAFDKLWERGATLLFGETTELTGAENIIASRCMNDDVRNDFMKFFNNYAAFIDKHKTSDMRDSQPSKGNIAGGLTTIEEKAYGNAMKIGRKAMICGALDKAEMPSGPGLWFMNSSSAGAEMMTLAVAAGFVVHFFPTGQGNVVGNPLFPVIKLTANPRTVRTMNEHIDLDVSALLRGEISLDDAGDLLLNAMFATIEGQMTSTEILHHDEFVMTRLYESA